jgi:hypothetical protein
MRVNFIIPGLGDSGGIQVVKKYAELFRERGIDVVIYSSVIADDLHRYPIRYKEQSTSNLLHVENIESEEE